MSDLREKPVVIRLTKKEADLIWRNADGWLDAGACSGGLEPDEAAALSSLCDQILRATGRLREPNNV